MGIHVATINLGYLIAAGSGSMAEYFAFRRDQISMVETGAFQGFSPSAVGVFTGTIPAFRRRSPG